jgi:hypothetical protein
MPLWRPRAALRRTQDHVCREQRAVVPMSERRLGAADGAAPEKASETSSPSRRAR